MFSAARWLLRHTGSPGSTRVFDYDLYRRTWDCLLCMFDTPPTVTHHYVVNSGSFLWALILFIYVRSMSGLSRSCYRWPEQNNIVRSRRSNDFVRSRFIRAHSFESELSYAAKHFLKHNSYWTGCFLKQWICLEQGSPNFLVRGPHKLLHNSSRAAHLTYCDYFGICYILPNQQIFRKYYFLLLTKCLRGPDEMAPRAVVWRPLV